MAYQLWGLLFDRLIHSVECLNISTTNYVKVGVSDLTFARYILETSLLHYDLNINTSPSVLAAAALTLVLKIKGTVTSKNYKVL